MESKQEEKFVLKQAEQELKKKQEELKEEREGKPAAESKEKPAAAKEEGKKKAEEKAAGKKEEKKEEKKREIVLERIYTIPMKKFLLHKTRMKRHVINTKAVREFAAKHMKAAITKVKIAANVVERLSRSGRNKLPIKIKVKASKDKEGVVWVELAS